MISEDSVLLSSKRNMYSEPWKSTERSLLPVFRSEAGMRSLGASSKCARWISNAWTNARRISLSSQTLPGLVISILHKTGRVTGGFPRHHLLQAICIQNAVCVLRNVDTGTDLCEFRSLLVEGDVWQSECSHFRCDKGSIEQTIRESTVLFPCIPKNVLTLNPMAEKEFNAMNPDAILINVSRGGVVHEEALLLNNDQLLERWWMSLRWCPRAVKTPSHSVILQTKPMMSTEVLAAGFLGISPSKT